jgi:hypothetical protein
LFLVVFPAVALPAIEESLLADALEAWQFAIARDVGALMTRATEHLELVVALVAEIAVRAVVDVERTAHVAPLTLVIRSANRSAANRPPLRRVEVIEVLACRHSGDCRQRTARAQFWRSESDFRFQKSFVEAEPMKNRKRRRGRPPLCSDGTPSVAFTTRVEQSVYDELYGAARMAGTTVPAINRGLLAHLKQQFLAGRAAGARACVQASTAVEKAATVDRLLRIRKETEDGWTAACVFLERIPDDAHAALIRWALEERACLPPGSIDDTKWWDWLVSLRSVPSYPYR